jgi:2-oxoglutarate ferredoxin oxidoreductase subunit beta
MLSHMYVPDFPVPVGVLRQIERPTYDDQLHLQIANAQQKNPANSVDDMIRGFGRVNTWTIN